MSKFDELFGERIKENTINSNNNKVVVTDDEVEMRRIDKILAIGLMLMILIIPLVVRAHFSDFVSPQVTGSDMDSGSKSDIFTYYKFILLIIGTSILSLIFLYKVFAVGYVIPKSKFNILVGIFLITIILSAVFAPNKTLALLGMYNRHDGTLSYICYIILFFIAANINYPSKMIKGMIYSLVPFILINATLGLFVIYDIDVFKWGWVNKLIFGELPEGSNVNAESQLWSTFNNPNYISGFAGTLTALFFTLAIIKENILEKLILLFISFASFSMVLTSLSSSGFVAFLITLPLILVIGFLSKTKVKSLLFFCFGILGFTLILNSLSAKNPQVWTESLGIILSQNPYVEVQESAKALLDFTFESTVFATDKENEISELPVLPSSGFSAGSGRTYIWDRVGKLIAERPILGYGLDTLVYHFPQDDPEKISGIGYSNVITDKPHNLFIGLAYGSGVVSAIAFTLLCLALLLKWINRLFRGKISLETKAIGMMILAFLIQAMFNDSILGFTNVLFIFIGVLAASVMYNKKGSLGEN